MLIQYVLQNTLSKNITLNKKTITLQSRLKEFEIHVSLITVDILENINNCYIIFVNVRPLSLLLSYLKNCKPLRD